MIALWLAARDPRTPWYAKAVAGAVAAYALSPIDLIPDFIPVFGYLDDVILVPLGIALAVRLIPPPLMEEYRAAATLRSERPASKLAIIVIIAVWAVALTIAAWLAWPHIWRVVSRYGNGFARSGPVALS
ncbi:MAG: YkvA family protein [Pseudomonadota bacterium]|nr:YkvA family protein [Pseudomonadota bacterium]